MFFHVIAKFSFEQLHLWLMLLRLISMVTKHFQLMVCVHFFIYGKLVAINGLRKLRNKPFCRIIFLVVLFNKIPLFSRNLINLAISFMSLFVSIIPEPILGLNFVASLFKSGSALLNASAPHQVLNLVYLQVRQKLCQRISFKLYHLRELSF